VSTQAILSWDAVTGAFMLGMRSFGLGPEGIAPV
jgi:hypothetical protein